MFLPRLILIRDWMYDAWRLKGYRAALCGASWRMDVMLNTADEYSARNNFRCPHALLNALSFAAITTTLIYWRKRRSELMYWCMRRPLHKP
jgi:hypothetical protein